MSRPVDKQEKPRRFITDYKEITETENFVENFDKDVCSPVDALMPYRLPEEIPCGIESCHTGHKFGYLVELSDGKRSKIGNCCGSKYFGKDFLSMTRALERRLDIEYFSHEVNKLKETLPAQLLDIRNTLDSTHDQAIVLSRFRHNFSELETALIRRAHLKKMEVTETVERSYRDIELEKAMRNDNGSSQQVSTLETKTVGHLSGLDVFTNGARDDAWQVIKKLKGVPLINTSDYSLTKLKKIVEEASSIPTLKDELIKWEKSFQAFYTPDNFALFELLEDVPESIRGDYYARAWDFETHQPKREKRKRKTEKKRDEWVRKHEKLIA